MAAVLSAEVDMESYQISLRKDKESLINNLRLVFESADESLLQSVQYEKYVVLDERNAIGDLQEILVNLLKDHYEDNK